ncbi:MAG: YicC/YloC family endoribonuclease, partial [Stellaceae bacterium]
MSRASRGRLRSREENSRSVKQDSWGGANPPRRHRPLGFLGAGGARGYKGAMTIASMTGFARVEGHDGALSWVWEVKSVNGKSLDLRFRLPGGFEALELPLRASVN